MGKAIKLSQADSPADSYNRAGLMPDLLELAVPSWERQIKAGVAKYQGSAEDYVYMRLGACKTALLEKWCGPVLVAPANHRKSMAQAMGRRVSKEDNAESFNRLAEGLACMMVLSDLSKDPAIAVFNRKTIWAQIRRMGQHTA